MQTERPNCSAVCVCITIIQESGSSEKKLLLAALGTLQIWDRLMKDPSEQKVAERCNLKEPVRTHSPAIPLQLNEAPNYNRLWPNEESIFRQII